MKASRVSQGGFTLVELMVAMAVMVLMLSSMAEMSSMAAKAWRVEQDRVDNFTKARAMLSLVTDDLQRGVFRGDLPAFGTGAPAATPTLTGNGLYYFTSTKFAAAFYTRQPGLASTSAAVRDVSLVSYQIIENDQIPSQSPTVPKELVLQRSNVDFPWVNGNGNLLFQGDISNLLTSGVAQQVAPGVVGFGLVFRRADGTLVAPQDPSASGSEQYTGYNSANPVVAVDVCLAVIGKQTLGTLSFGQTQVIQTTLQNALTANNLNNPVAGVTSKGIKAIWDQTTIPSLIGTSYPKDLGTGLKTFECWVGCQPF